MGDFVDDIGGYHTDAKLAKWPMGSLWECEGKRLYDLVRKHRPTAIVEIGTHHGCSTSHLALGLKHNGHGHLWTLDNHQQLGDETGKMIPAELMRWITMVTCDAMAPASAAKFKNIDLLFEDGAHTTVCTRTILTNFPARIVAVHDVEHFNIGKVVKPAAEGVLGLFDEIFFEPPADCGIGIRYCDAAMKPGSDAQ